MPIFPSYSQEKEIIIPSAASGISMATRTGFEADISTGYTRHMEIVQVTETKFYSPWALTACRGESSLVSSADSFDVTTLTVSGMGAIIVGDKCKLRVMVHQSVSGGSCVITPVIFDQQTSGLFVGVLEPKTFTIATTTPFRTGSGSGNYLSHVQSWDTVGGAHQIGFHISNITGSGNGVKVYAWMI